MSRVDLNVDLAEGYPFDGALMKLASSVNVCMGAHAGSPGLTGDAVAEAIERGLRWGAHPGYPDRDGMGRRPWSEAGLSEKMTRGSLLAQAVAAQSLGATYLKPHGAFYNETTQPCLELGWLEEALRETGLALLGTAGSEHERAARRNGVAFIAEGFADRAVGPDGRLLPRSHPGAVLTDPAEAAAQAVSLLGRVDSICVHGDTPGCVDVLRAVREAVEAAGYGVGA